MQDLTAILEALAPGVRIADVRELTGGVSAMVVAVDLEHADGRRERVVVRHRAASPAWGERRSVALEHELLVSLHAAGVPVPRPRLVWGDDTSVMDFVEGTTELPPGAEHAMAEALAHIHGVQGAFVHALPEREDPVPTLRALLPADELRPLLALNTAPGAACLLHGDFWAANLLWRDGALVAVLDWEDAAVGDPLSDLACARVELEVAVSEAASAAFTEHYLRVSGRDATRLPMWDVYVSATSLAVMDQWGLAPHVLEHRRAVTQRFRDRALSSGMVSNVTGSR